MANGHGGARIPSNPSVVSGPGQHSRRTDGQTVAQLPNAGYGEAAEFAQIQQGAPVASTGPAPQGGGGPGIASMLAGLTGLGAPSGDPNEPVTAGASAGPGAGPEALGLPQDSFDMNKADAASIPPGQLQALVLASQRPDATPSFRTYVRQILASR